MGPNASGKTNAVEALQLLTALSSFRNAKSAELVRKGSERARAQCEVSDGARQLSISLTLEAGKRTYEVNGKKRAPKALRGTLPSVTFTPDDLNLVKGSGRYRRHELDVLGSQLNANYFQLVRDFEKVLRHKNRLLKDEAPEALIEATDDLYVKVADQLTNYRIALFDRLAPHICSSYEEISGGRECLTVSYEKSWGKEGKDETLAAAVLASKPDERLRHRALVGPHLDDLLFSIDGMEAGAFASQGQQRSIVLALKLAEAEVIEEILGQLPVLLLDDVMSELDGTRRRGLVQTMLEGKQTFITTANIDYFDKHMLERARIVDLRSP